MENVMGRVRVNVPVVLEVPDATLALLKAAAPLVETISAHAPALRALSTAGRGFVREANAILAAEKKKKRAGPRR
jgi:hypothetical protein